MWNQVTLPGRGGETAETADPVVKVQSNIFSTEMHFDHTLYVGTSLFDKQVNCKNIHWEPLKYQHLATTLTFPNRCYLDRSSQLKPRQRNTASFRSKRNKNVAHQQLYVCWWHDMSRMAITVRNIIKLTRHTTVVILFITVTRSAIRSTTL